MPKSFLILFKTMEPTIEILKNLNEEQKKAVTYGNGPVLIIAGAGTGKTTVITQRIAWLILTGRARPEEILALTFTDKASGEMEERVDKILPYGYVDLWILTFHSFCERVLRDHALDIGLSPNFKLLNQTEQSFLIRQNFERFNLDYYKPLGNPYKFIKSLITHFSRAKDEMVTPKEYLDYAENLKLDEDASQGDEILKGEKARLKEIAEAYATYQQLLFDNESLDFGDLILQTNELFKKRPQILKKYQQRFKYILVDEFQDTNWAQYELLKLLISDDLNLTVVSDDKQAIYRWRGAAYSNIYQLKKDFPQTKIIFLKNNYRSKQKILDLAYKFINQNYVGESLSSELKKSLSKDLTATRPGEAITEFFDGETLEEEVKWVAEKIIKLKGEVPSLSFNDFAILVRANNQAEPFAQMLQRAEIPYQFLAKSGLFAKPIVLDIIAYLKLLDNYHESNALYRILSSPLLIKNFKNEDLSNLVYAAKKRGLSLYEAAKNISLIPGVSAEGVKSLMALIFLIEKHTQLAKIKPVSEVVYSFLEESGYLNILKKRGEEGLTGVEEISWLNQFFKKITEFENTTKDKSVHSFIQLINIIFEIGGMGGDLGLDEQMGPESVKVLTIHSAKGLEFKYVFIVNLVEHQFPTINRSDPISLPDDLIKEIIPEGDVHLQEERRLFYVAMTRAKDGLFFTAAKDYGGKRKKKISPFLYELNLVSAVREPKEFLGSLEFLQPPPKNKFPLRKEYLPPKEFSFSQIEAYKNCPLQYKFSFILKLPRRGNCNMSFGKTIHDTFYQFLKENLNKKVTQQTNLFKGVKDAREILSMKRLEDIYEKCWIDEWFVDKKQKEEYKKKGKKMLENFYQDILKTKPKVKELEFPFSFKLSDYPFRGKIDRINEVEGGLEFLDYKTGKPKKGSLEDRKQLLIYQMAGEVLFRDKIVRLTYYYLENGEKQSFSAKVEDLEKTKEKVIQIIEKIKKGDFPPRPSELCNYCDFKDICEYRLT